MPGGYPDCCSPRGWSRCPRISHNPPGERPAGARVKNWYRFYCSDGVKEGLRGATCTEEKDVTLRCFTSEDSNFSCRASLFDLDFLFAGRVSGKTNEPHSLSSFFHNNPNNNGMLEVTFIYSMWTGWAMPICLSVRGVFHHDGYGGRGART